MWCDGGRSASFAQKRYRQKNSFHEVVAERAESAGVMGREDALRISDGASLRHGGCCGKH